MILVAIIFLIGFIGAVFQQPSIYFFSGIALLIAQHPKGSGWLYLLNVIIGLLVHNWAMTQEPSPAKKRVKHSNDWIV